MVILTLDCCGWSTSPWIVVGGPPHPGLLWVVHPTLDCGWSIPPWIVVGGPPHPGLSILCCLYHYHLLTKLREVIFSVMFRSRTVGTRAVHSLLRMLSFVVVANKWIREFGQEFRRPCGRHMDDTDEELYLTEFGQEFQRPRG